MNSGNTSKESWAVVHVLCDKEYDTHKTLSLLIVNILVSHPLIFANHYCKWFVDEIARISGSNDTPVVPVNLRESHFVLTSVSVLEV